MITGTEDRQHAYVALSRGTDVNLAYVFTTSLKRADPAPGPRPAPEPARFDQFFRDRTGARAPVTPLAPPGTALMDARKERIGEHAADHAPPWAIAALGPVPAHPLGRAAALIRLAEGMNFPSACENTVSHDCVTDEVASCLWDERSCKDGLMR